MGISLLTFIGCYMESTTVTTPIPTKPQTSNQSTTGSTTSPSAANTEPANELGDKPAQKPGDVLSEPPELKLDPVSEPKPEPTKPEIKPAPTPEPPKPEPKPAPAPEPPKPEPKPAPTPEPPKPEPKPAPTPEPPKPEPKPAPTPEPSSKEPKAVLSVSEAKVANDKNVKKEPLPALTIRFADIDTILAVAKKIAGIIGTSGEQFDKTVDTILSNVNGLSKTEPIGLVFRTNGNDFNDPLFLLPIKDLSKFSIPSLPLLRVEKIDAGKFRIVLPNFNLLAYQKNNYAVLVLEASTAPIPAEPKSYLADVEKYTMGIKIDFANTSYDEINKLLAPMMLILAIQNPEASEQFQKTIEQTKLYFDEFKTLDYGITVNSKTLDLVFESNLLPNSSSKIFSKIATVMKDRKTIFGGFKTSKAPLLKFSNAVAFPEGTAFPAEWTNASVEQFDVFFNGILKQVEEDAETKDEVKHAKAIINSLKKLIAASIIQTKADYTFSLDGEGTFLAASILKETDEVVVLFNSVMGFIQAKHSESKNKEKYNNLIKTNLKKEYETVSGYKLSSLKIPIDEVAGWHSIPIPPQLKGKSYTIFTAVKDNVAIAVASGFDAGQTETELKAALQKTSSPTKIEQPTLQFDLKVLGQLLRKIGFEEMDKSKPNAELAKIFVDLLENAGNNAKIIFTDKMKGSTYSGSIKIDGTIISTIAKFAKQAYEKSNVSDEGEEDDDDDN
jgi:uncharacterized ubiquitin-like protein YukD